MCLYSCASHREKKKVTPPVIIIEENDRSDVLLLKQKQLTDSIEPYTLVEQMPQFPGGEIELNKFIRDNLKYPSVSKENSIQSRIIIRFIVGADGNLYDFKSLRNNNSELEKEIIKIFQSMPKWIPGKQNGEAVPVYYTFSMSVCFH